MNTSTPAVHRLSRPALVGILVAAMAVFTLGGLPTAAHATTATVNNEADLATNLGSGDGTVTLGSSFDVAAPSLDVSGTVTLDLAGFTLNTHNIHLATGTTLTITDSSLLSAGNLFALATAPDDAGITTTGGTLIISGGTITATGTDYGAGIGGDNGGDGGTFTVIGGTVTANADESWSAAIGGGYHGNGGTVNILAGTVTADSAGYGAGIGGGYGGDGGQVYIGAAARVMAGAPGPLGSAVVPSAIGAGVNSSGFGTLELEGELMIPVGSAIDLPTGATISGDGLATGFGTINNSGAITAATIDIGWIINGNNYPVTFDDNYGTAPTPQVIHVYATTFTAGNRAFPTAPTRAGWTFAGWNGAADGSGTAPALSTDLSTLTPSITFYAQWTLTPPTTLSLAPATSTVTAGDSVTFTATGTTLGDRTSDVAFSSNNTTAPLDVVTGNSIRFTTAGTHTITATLNSDHSVKITATVTVNPAAPAAITLRLSDTTVDQGDTIAAHVSGTDAYGNPVDTTGTTLSSDHTTDVISGTSIRFPHASTHVITATLGSGPTALTSSVTVTVTPKILPVTGYTTTPAPWIALLLLLLGLSAVIAARRRRA